LEAGFGFNPSLSTEVNVSVGFFGKKNKLMYLEKKEIFA